MLQNSNEFSTVISIIDNIPALPDRKIDEYTMNPDKDR